MSTGAVKKDANTPSSQSSLPSFHVIPSKVTSSFDRQGPPSGTQTQGETKKQSPKRGGGGGGGGSGSQSRGQGHDYYTLSRAGITHLKDTSSDFTALDRWEREYALFHQIRRSEVRG